MTSFPLPVLQPGTGYSSLVGRPIDNTALACYMECPRRYYYSMVLHRRREGLPSPAIAYGSAWHKAMETHYKTNGDRDEVRMAVLDAWEDHDRPDDHRTLARVLLEYDRYVEHWGLPEAETARTVGWPHQPLVEISTELSWPGAAHPYAGKIDRIIEMNGQIFVEDHKTSSRKPDFRQFEMSNQMMGYAYMAQLITGRAISGVRINAHTVLKNDSSFERHIISYSQERLKAWAENYNCWIARIEDDMAAVKSAYPEQAAGAFPYNFVACAGKYGMCAYTSVCSQDPRIRQRVLEMDFAVNPWNPLEAPDEEA